MRLSCPSCGAEYALPETLFLSGPRKVRCVKCGHAWSAGAPEAASPPPEPAAGAPPEEVPAPADESPPRRPLPLRRRPPPPVESVLPPDLGLDPPRAEGGGRLAAAWVASVLFLAGVCWAGWEYRADVIAAWPASAHLYAALGGLPER